MQENLVKMTKPLTPEAVFMVCMYLGLTEPKQVDGFATYKDGIGEVPQEHGHTVSHILGHHHIATAPVVLVCDIQARGG